MVLDLSTVGLLVWLASVLATAWIAAEHGAHPVAYATVGMLLGPIGVLWVMWKFSVWGDDAGDPE